MDKLEALLAGISQLRLAGWPSPESEALHQEAPEEEEELMSRPPSDRNLDWEGGGGEEGGKGGSRSRGVSVEGGGGGESGTASEVVTEPFFCLFTLEHSVDGYNNP